MQEVDFTRPSSEDFEDWQDMEHDDWFHGMVEDILACYTGEAASTDAGILALSEKYSMGDISNAFEYFSTVKDEVPDPEDITAEYLEYREKVVNLLNLFKPKAE